MKLRFVSFVIFALANTACGGGDASCPEGTVAAGDGCVEAVDAGGGDAGLGADAGCDPSGPDPIDPAGRDDNCDGSDGIASEQVYVSTTGDDSNVGTLSSPLRSIARAVQIAGTRPILVSTGTFVASVEMTGGQVRIHGGYLPDQGWSRGAANTIAQVEAGGWRLLDLTGDSMLERIDLSSGAATVEGESSIALTISGSGIAFAVEDAVIGAGAGADGVAGSDGGTGTPGTPGAPGDLCRRSGGGECIAGDTISTPPPAPACTAAVASAGTGGGTNSNGGASGAGRAGGAKNTSAGTPASPGESGGAGAAGTDGTGGANIGAFGIGGYTAAVAAGGDPGDPGEGGGGGGGGVSYAADDCSSAYAFTPSGSAGGSGGNGGCGGAPGGGGSGGGASVAIIVSGVSLSLVDVIVRADLGGRGGAGGDGGSGGAGGGGGAGGAGACGMDASTVVRGDPGGAGGDGGAGGRGGHGGGGMGGPSLGVVLIGGAELSQQDTDIEPAAGGFGGASLGNIGTPGLSQDVLTIATVE